MRKGPKSALAIEGYADLVEIGAGTSATVYRAFQEAFQRQVALKVLTADLRDQRAQKRFVSERAMTGRLSRHPNVITVYDSGFAAGRRPYLAMEYFARGSFSQVVAETGPLPLTDALRVGVKIAGALESAHRAGVIHRDIKPQNVLLSGFGEPVLADFGLAVATDPEASFTAGLTPAHAAPELLEGSQPTVATDLYALGSTLYTLLAGRPPFAGPVGEGLLAQFRRIAIGDVPAITRADLPPSTMALLRKSLATAPGDRFRTAAEFGRALQGEQSALGLPVTELVLEAETALAPTSRSIVDARAVEETATRGAVFAPAPAAPPPPPAPPSPSTTAGEPPRDPTLVGRMPPPPPPVAPSRSRKKPVIMGVCAVIAFAVVGTGVELAADGVFTGGHQSASTRVFGRVVGPQPSVVPRSGGASSPPPAPTRASSPTPAPTHADALAPTGLTAHVSGPGQVTLTWRDHTGGQAGQVIYVITHGAPNPEQSVAKGTTSAVVTVTSATAPTCFRVFAIISATETPGSPSVCINGGVAPTASPSD